MFIALLVLSYVVLRGSLAEDLGGDTGGETDSYLREGCWIMVVYRGGPKKRSPVWNVSMNFVPAVAYQFCLNLP